MTTTTLPTLMNRRAAAAALGLSVSTLVKWRREGRGPRPIRLTDGPRGRCVYRAEDVLAWAADPQRYEAAHRAPMTTFPPPIPGR
jgi:hypothetical protein